MDDHLLMNRFFNGSVPISSFAPHNIAYPAIAPQLVILSQKSHSEEVVSKNGIQKTIHIVVKNSPFHIQLGVAGSASSKVDFNQIAFDAHLIYDCEGDKEVDFVKVKPMEFKATASENGQLLDCELRIKVLTSQHEDMLFKIRIVGSNPITHEEVCGLTVISSPIKVISKPEQLKKKQPNKKRTITDMLVETVSRIEKKQEEQQKLLERLLQQQSEHAQIITEKKQKTEPNFLWDDLNIDMASFQNVESVTLPPKKVPEFEDAFVTLIKAYNTMKPEERPEIIRKLIRGSSSRETERLSELFDLFWSEGLQKELGRNAVRSALPNTGCSKEDGCSCVECPHKLELERIDEFYKEFLSAGSLPMSANFSNDF